MSNPLDNIFGTDTPVKSSGGSSLDNIFGTSASTLVQTPLSVVTPVNTATLFPKSSKSSSVKDFISGLFVKKDSPIFKATVGENLTPTETTKAYSSLQNQPQAPGQTIKFPFVDKGVQVPKDGGIGAGYSALKNIFEFPEKATRSVTELFGFSQPDSEQRKTQYSVPSYAEVAGKSTGELIDQGYPPAAAVIFASTITGGQFAQDALMFTGLLESGAAKTASNSTSAITSNEIKTAHEFLGNPKTLAEARANMIKLQKEFHPDITGGSDVISKQANNAYRILEKEGIPVGKTVGKVDNRPQVKPKALGDGSTTMHPTLLEETKQALQTHGPEATHLALTENLGVTNEQATKIITTVKQYEALHTTEKLAQETLAKIAPVKDSGHLQGINPEQKVKLTTDQAVPLAQNAADIHYNEVHTPALQEGKATVIGADDLKDHFAKDYNDNNHLVYSRAAYLQYEKALKENPNSTVILTGGGPASGKTELLTKNIIDHGFNGIIYDSNMANYDGVVKQIDMAQKAGKNVEIYGVLPNLENARTFSIQRENKTGRGISDQTFARGHAGFPQVALRLLKEGKIGPKNVHILDTRNVTSYQEALNKVITQDYLKDPFAILKELKYNESTLKETYAKQNYNTKTGERTSTSQKNDGLSVRSESSETPSGNRTNQGDANRKGNENILGESNELQKIIDSTPESKKIGLSESLNFEYNPESGFVSTEPVKKVVDTVKDFIESTHQGLEESKNLDDSLYTITKQAEADKILALKLIKKIDISIEDAEAIYHYEEDNSLSLTNHQKEVYEQSIKPLAEASTKIANKLKENIPIDTEGYTPRFVKGRGNVIDRLVSGAKGIGGKGSILGKTAPSLKHRTMKALVDEDGNRLVASIKNGRVSVLTNKKGVDFGGLRSKANIDNKNKSEFINKSGKKYKIVDATTKEIEANTNLTYHKNVFVNRMVSYLNLRQVERATDFLEAYKESPDFKDISIKFGTGEAPKGYTTTINPSFRGYMLDPHVANVMDKYTSAMMKGKDPLRALTSLNAFLRTAIFFNPLIHIPNIGVHWLVNRGASKFLNPMAYKRLGETSARAISAVIHQNADYIEMLNSGAPLLYSTQNTRNMHNALLAKMTAEIDKNPQLDFLKKALKSINPYVLSGKATWLVNDVATMQAIYEEMELGKTMEEAIKDVGAHIPNYRLPANKVVELLTNPNITMFGAYHYGALRSYYEMAKTLVSGDTAGVKNIGFKNKTKARADVLDKLVMLGLIGLVLYPAIDNALQKSTGNTRAKARRAGAVTFFYNGVQVASGNQDFSQFMQSIMTPAVGSKELVSQLFNLDLFTGQHIRDTSATGSEQLKEAGAHAIKTIAPIAEYQKVDTGAKTTDQFLASLAGISLPDAVKTKFVNKVQSTQTKVDKLDKESVAKVKPIYEEAKKLGFGTPEADAIVNDLTTAEYNIYKDLKAIDTAKNELNVIDKIQPIVMETSRLGFGTPEADKLVNDLTDEEYEVYKQIKSSLYGTDKNELPTYEDNSTHDEKSFIGTIVTYAKAFGVDPITAFKDILKGQVIRRVDNKTIIVERLSLAKSEEIKKRGGGNNADMKLDHTLPLELGGTNEENNLKLVTTDEWKSYTPVENYLAKALTEQRADKKTVQKLIKQFKNKEITFDEIKSIIETQ